MICEHNKDSSWLLSGLIEAFWLIYLVEHLSGCHLSVLTLKPVWFFSFSLSSFYYTELGQMSIQIKCPKINRMLIKVREELSQGQWKGQHISPLCMHSPSTWGLSRFGSTRHCKIFISWWYLNENLCQWVYSMSVLTHWCSKLLCQLLDLVREHFC